ncbi:MAG: thiamine phosphate synthase [Methylococcales bacterium]|mgnify:CR=1 FL=1|jgi:thiamine-phosphate pyrophosphorylase|nr:thiamine phosphate synthase [Methylococcales bacterium]MBT7445205.1 thiamine phosphate synthase [Methylococcales bacterium]
MIKPGLYLITDEHLVAPEDLPELIGQVAPYLSLLQFRAKTLPHDQQVTIASALQHICTAANIPFLVNDDVALAKACGADGVHLGQSDQSALMARQQLGDKAIIGVTCHDSLTLAQTAIEQSADYVAFGRFFPSKTKAQAKPANIETLTMAAKMLDVPIVAIGGITTDNGSQLRAAGADILAVIHDVLGAKNPVAAAKQYQSLF